MKKRITFTLIGLLLVVAVLGGIKALQIRKMIAAGENFVMPPETITTAAVQRQTWTEGLSAVGSVEAIQGVEITAELSGKIVELNIEPGTTVRKGDLLLRQDTSSEAAQLKGAKSALTLAGIELNRTKELLSRNLVSQSELDNAEARFDEASAGVEELEVAIAKKTIRAPFSGHLGIRRVSLGQVISEGQEIVPLNTLDPVFVNFSLPQQDLPSVSTGLEVEITSSAVPGKTFVGTLTAMDSGIDPSTRNVLLQATVPNPRLELRPGMFVRTNVRLKGSEEVLIVPVTAVLNAPYGDQAFVVEEQPAEGDKPGGLTVRAQFVRVGENRGDYVSVLSGLKEGDLVASTGVFKLRNGQGVVIDNKLSPEFELEPTPENQ